MSLQGKVAVVTGGARGLGRAISLRLAQDGVAISVWDLQLEGAQETAALIQAAGGRAIAGAGAMSHYVASKGGVIGLTKALAMEFATRGITVNTVPPGFVNTEGLREAPVDIAGFAQTTPMKRSGKPENIAAAVAFLASEEA